MNDINNKTALLLIDIQKGFQHEEYWGGNRNNPQAEEKAAMLLKRWRELSYPVFHVVHSSQDPQSMLHKSNVGFAIQEVVKPVEGEAIVEKSVNSAFIGTDLDAQLQRQHITALVIVGLTTDHCVSTTTRMAGNMGYQVSLVADATATFNRQGINGEKFDAELVHQTALASLHNEFATVTNTETLLKTARRLG